MDGWKEGGREGWRERGYANFFLFLGTSLAQCGPKCRARRSDRQLLGLGSPTVNCLPARTTHRPKACWLTMRFAKIMVAEKGRDDKRETGSTSPGLAQHQVSETTAAIPHVDRWLRDPYAERIHLQPAKTHGRFHVARLPRHWVVRR